MQVLQPVIKYSQGSVESPCYNTGCDFVVLYYCCQENGVLLALMLHDGVHCVGLSC
jgi:hypothetical protein